MIRSTVGTLKSGTVFDVAVKSSLSLHTNTAVRMLACSQTLARGILVVQICALSVALRFLRVALRVLIVEGTSQLPSPEGRSLREQARLTRESDELILDFRCVIIG
jgi:hypothetical protein